jgi:hypothetical protein
MQSIFYRPGKNAIGALAAAALALFSATSWLSDDSTVMGVAALFFAFAAFAGMRKAFSSRPALQYDAQSLTIDKTFGEAKIGWCDVQTVTIEQLTIRYMGLIPVSKRQFLVIRLGGGAFGSKKHRIAAGGIQLPTGGVAALCATLTAMQLAAAGGASSRPSLAPSVATAAEPAQSAFDPDAAIARYLAQKEAEAQYHQSQQQFAAQPAIRSSRPTFGRKVS